MQPLGPMYDMSGMPGMAGPVMMLPDIQRHRTTEARLDRMENEVMQQRLQQSTLQSTLPPMPMAPPPPPTKEHEELAFAHSQMLHSYMALASKHAKLMGEVQQLMTEENLAVSKAPILEMNKQGSRRQAACLGVIRLDYDYPPAPGDIDSPESYEYDVYYRVVPGLTFQMCQSGKMTSAVEEQFVAAIKYLEAKQVSGITGDCGFMMYFQALARQHTRKPVFMSALAQLPAVTCAFSKHELIAVFTANGKTLAPMKDLIKDECGVDPEEKRFIIVGCQDVPGFEAVAAGEKVNVEYVTPGMIKKAKKVLAQYPKIRAFLLECTELPPYADAIRSVTGLPVFDAITSCNYFITGLQDNKRFGLNDWQEAWDGKQDSYSFGANLSDQQAAHLVNKRQEMPLRPDYVPNR